MGILLLRDLAVRVFVGLFVLLINILAIQVGYPSLNMPLGYDVGYWLFSPRFLFEMRTVLMLCQIVKLGTRCCALPTV